MSTAAFFADRLLLARELRGLTQAALAKRLDVTSAAVSMFEQGGMAPNPSMTSRLADVLDVPAGFFRLPLTATHEGFFRSLRRTPVAHRRRARAIAQVAHDLVLLSDPSRLPPVQLPIVEPTDMTATSEQLEEIAGQVRRVWQVPLGPIGDVVALLEGHGILVIRLPLDSAAVDAFSLPYADRPVIVLGSDKGDRARSRFDAAHELGHLVAHGHHIWGIKEVENQAHAFAAAFLMPADEIAPHLPSRPDWPVLFELKKHWQVSLAALLMRAKTLGVMNESQYLTAIKAASARGWRRREPVPLGPPEEPTLLQEVVLRERDAEVQTLPTDVIQTLLRATSGLKE